MRQARAVATMAILGVFGAGLMGVPAAQASAPSACGNADLRASFVRTDAGAGHVYGRLRLRNTSGHPCTTGGFGGLSYVGHGDGTQIGAPASRDHAIRVRKIKLEPGQRVISQVAMLSAQAFPKRR